MFKRFFKKHNKKIIAFIGVLATTICGVLGITKTYAQEYNNQWVNLLDDFTTSNSKIKTARIVIHTENYDYTLYDRDVSYNILPSISEYNNCYNVLLNPTNISGITYINNEYLYENQYITSFDIYGINTFNINLTNVNNEDTKAFYGLKYHIYNNNVYLSQIQDSQQWNYSVIFSSTNQSNIIDNRYREVVFNNTEIEYTTANKRKLSFGGFINYNRSLDINGGDNLVFSDIEMYGLENLDLKTLFNNNWVDDTQYNDLQDNYDTLENDYNTLQDNYDNLNSDYNELINSANGGIFNYLTNLYAYGDRTMEFTREELINNGTINGSTFDYGVLYNLYPNASPNGNLLGEMSFGFPTPVNLNILNLVIDTNMSLSEGVSIDLIQKTPQGTLNPSVRYVAWIPNSTLIQWNYIINYDNLQSIMVGTVLENFNAFTQISFGGIETFFTDTSYLRITSINTPYQIGFQSGYNEGFTYGRSTQQSTIDNLTEDISNLNQQITDMQLIINALNEQISGINDDYNLNNLIWTIGGTPFESFKHIWNVNFFGVNVADFILGFITTFLGLYIFKKFFF